MQLFYYSNIIEVNKVYFNLAIEGAALDKRFAEGPCVSPRSQGGTS